MKRADTQVIKQQDIRAKAGVHKICAIKSYRKTWLIEPAGEIRANSLLLALGS